MSARRIKDIDGLPISDAERKQIYEGNARKLLRWPSH